MALLWNLDLLDTESSKTPDTRICRVSSSVSDFRRRFEVGGLILRHPLVWRACDWSGRYFGSHSKWWCRRSGGCLLGDTTPADTLAGNSVALLANDGGGGYFKHSRYWN